MYFSSLIVFLTLVYSTLGNFYFTSSDTRLYAVRNIKNFDVNLQNLAQIITNLSRQHDLVPSNAYRKYLKNIEKKVPSSCRFALHEIGYGLF